MSEEKRALKKSAERMDLELRFERARTEKAEMQLKKAQGELIEIDSVKHLLFSIAAQTKEKLERIPQNTARNLVGLKDPRDIEAILKKEISAAMLELSRAGQRGYMLSHIEEREMGEGQEPREDDPEEVVASSDDDDDVSIVANEKKEEPKRTARKKAAPSKLKERKKPERDRYDPYLEDDDE
jgi:hypothetical protein